jgi:hypothetical protein
VLTNNHRGDAKDAVQIADLKLVGKVVYQKHAYVISEDVQAQEIVKAKPNETFLKQTQKGVAYVESETYYIFQRVY